VTKRAEPVRTCVGCRSRAAKSDLLRIVREPAAGQPAAGAGPAIRVVPDPRGCMPGRGAHLHPDPECLALAERRRAFGRAFRLDGACDVTPVREWVASDESPRGLTPR
jgi:predicted RNA-binding protein YlxR (DUF448 family)